MIISLAFNYLSVSIGVGIIALIFWLIQKKIKLRYRVDSLSIIWIAMACCLLIPIGNLISVGKITKIPIEISIPSSSTIASTKPTLPSQNNKVVISELPVTESSLSNSKQTSTAHINLSILFKYFWLTGILLFSVYHSICYCILRFSIRRYSEDCPENIQKMLESVKFEFSIKRNVRIRQYCKCSSPFLIGIFRPTIILPKASQETLLIKFALRHELMHYKNKDISIKLLVLIANAIHFYNPMAYVIRNQISLSRELVCDKKVLKGKKPVYVRAYGNAILNSLITSWQSAITTQFGGSKNLMKERLSQMLDFSNKKKGIVLIAATVFVITIASTALAINPRPDNENSNLDVSTYTTDYSTPITYNTDNQTDDQTDVYSQDHTEISSEDTTTTLYSSLSSKTNTTTYTNQRETLSTDAKSINENSNKNCVSTTNNTLTTQATKSYPDLQNGVITNYKWHSEMQLCSNNYSHKTKAFCFKNRQQMLNKLNELSNPNIAPQYDDSFFQTKAIVMLNIFEYNYIPDHNQVTGVKINNGDLIIDYKDLELGPRETVACILCEDFIFIEINQKDINGINSIQVRKTSGS